MQLAAAIRLSRCRIAAFCCVLLAAMFAPASARAQDAADPRAVLAAMLRSAEQAEGAAIRATYDCDLDGRAANLLLVRRLEAEARPVWRSLPFEEWGEWQQRFFMLGETLRVPAVSKECWERLRRPEPPPEGYRPLSEREVALIGAKQSYTDYADGLFSRVEQAARRCELAAATAGLQLLSELAYDTERTYARLVNAPALANRQVRDALDLFYNRRDRAYLLLSEAQSRCPAEAEAREARIDAAQVQALEAGFDKLESALARAVQAQAIADCKSFDSALHSAFAAIYDLSENWQLDNHELFATRIRAATDRWSALTDQGCPLPNGEDFLAEVTPTRDLLMEHPDPELLPGTYDPEAALGPFAGRWRWRLTQPDREVDLMFSEEGGELRLEPISEPPSARTTWIGRRNGSTFKVLSPVNGSYECPAGSPRQDVIGGLEFRLSPDGRELTFRSRNWTVDDSCNFRWSPDWHESQPLRRVDDAPAPEPGRPTSPWDGPSSTSPWDD